MTSDANDINDQAVQVIIKQVVQVMDKLRKQNDASIDAKIAKATIDGKNIRPFTIDTSQIGLSAMGVEEIEASIKASQLLAVGTE